MDNYIVFILWIALFAMVADGMTTQFPKIQQSLYTLFLFILSTLFLIRYYYGPDIMSYVPHYENIASPLTLFHHPEQMTFEWGYEMFCSVLHLIGISYWGMTAVITILYFTALTLLFRFLTAHRLFALSCVVLFDYSLIYAQNRQCLAIAFFIFFILCLQKRRWLYAALWGLLVVLTHKSGFLPVALTLAGGLLYFERESASPYHVLVLILSFLLLIPVSKIGSSLLSLLPLPETYITSLAHHLKLGRQFQTIAFLYIAVFMLISIYHTHHFTRYDWIAVSVLIGAVMIVVLYQYYFLLNRIRSYFTPLIVFYVIRLISDTPRTVSVPYAGLIRQTVAVMVFLYCCNSTSGYMRASRQFHAPVTKACTLFDLRHHSAQEIRNRQMRIAAQYWREDYMKDNHNKL